MIFKFSTSYHFPDISGQHHPGPGRVLLTPTVNPIPTPIVNLTPTQTPGTADDEYCVVCMDRVREVTLVHGETGHTCCCNNCAIELQKSSSGCPMCRLPIEAIIKVFM